MNFKSYILPICCFLFLLSGSFVEYQSFRSPNVLHYKNVIEEDLHQREKAVYAISDESSRLERILTNDYEDQTLLEADLQWLDQLSKSAYTLHLYQQDSLVFWSNNDVYLQKGKQSLGDAPSQFVRLSDGYYEAIQYPLTFENGNSYQFIGFIPIKHSYNLNSKYLKAQFATDTDIPRNLNLYKKQKNENSHALTTVKGETLCYVNNAGPLIDQRKVRMLFLMYLLGFIILGVLIDRYARHLVASKSLFAGASFLIVSIAVLRILSTMSNFTDRFETLTLFTKTPEIFFFGNSLGDFILNIGLILWVVLFIHRYYRPPFYGHLAFPRKFLVAFLNTFGIVFAIANVAAILKQLIFHSNVPFNFDNVFNLESSSLYAIGGVILLLISLFLIGHFLMMMTMQTKLKIVHRVAAYVLAILAFIPLSYFYNLNLLTPSVFAFLVLFIGLFDIFLEHETNNYLTWLVTWLVILAGISSSLLYSYNQDKEGLNRLKYVEGLMTPKDTIVEQKIVTLQQQLFQDATILEFQQKGDAKINDALYQSLNKHYSDVRYLYNNYDYDAYFWDTNKNGFNNNFAIVEKSDNSTLYFDENEETYYLKIPYALQIQDETKKWWVLKFSHEQRKQSKVYSELLTEQSYKNLTGLKNYDYAVYKNNNRIKATSNIFGESLSLSEFNSIPEEALVETVSSGVLTTSYKSGDKSVFLQKSLGGYTKPISLFSFVFAILILFVFCMSLINAFSGIFPKTLNISVSTRPSLRGKIQFYVISLIVVSFILIGVVTVLYFSNSHEEYHENRLGRKTESVIKDTERELGLLMEDLPEGVSFTDKHLNLIDLEAVSKIHRMDVNLFDKNGRLVNSSEMDIFNKGVASPQMNAMAYQELVRLGAKHFNDIYQDKEKIGTLDYKSSYIPLKYNNKTLAYLGLPYYSKQSKLREDVTVFMGTLLNVYVFLLIIAGAIAIVVANSITKPIAVIGEKLKQFKIGGQNEPLEWHSHDELGALIDEYNRMVLKVKEGADTLAQSEREGAWREMAKQVAHEIKNPLTPMKLSIQYLTHAYRSNPSDIEPLLKRVSTTLIEQIDNLSQIASEFSNFAKMPRAENQRILLNHLVHSVYDLFKEDPHSVVNLDLPEDDYYVYADKNHLIRVFNNLIKNATQAIPDEREGLILVRMFTEKGKIIVEVRDNGTGISEEMKEKVFVPNFTTKNSGTGLGLAISKNIIESVNGEIYFITKVGKGTSFFVKLPVIDIKKPEEVLIG